MPHTKSISVSQAGQSLAASGNLSKPVAQLLATDDRPVQLANITRGFDDPVMSCFLIDASGSMTDYRNAVIQGQNMMLDTLRGSSKCRKKALYVAQYLFSTDSRPLNPFVQLDSGKNDPVVVLNSGNYSPSGGTALYTTVYQVLQDMAANIAYALGQQIKATFTLGVITDGEDTEGGVDPGDIKTIVQELKAKGHLAKSVILGITHSKLPPDKVNEIKERLGFDEAVSVSQNPSDIRRAFALASQSAVKAQV